MTEALVDNQKSCMRAKSSLEGNGAVHFKKTLKSITVFVISGEPKFGTGASVGAGYCLKSQPFAKQTRWVCVEMLMAYKQRFRNNRSQLLTA